MADIKLAPNVPTTIDVRYCDVINGQYRARLRFKGTVDGQDDAVIWADAAPTLQNMVALEICAPVDYDSDAIPKKGIEVKLAKRKLVFINEQKAGEKRPTLRVLLPGVSLSPARASSTNSPEKAGRPESSSPAMRSSPVPTPVERSAARGPSGTPALSQSPEGKKARTQLYERLTKYALEKVAPIYRDAGLPCDAKAVAAIVDSMYRIEVWNVA